MCGINEDFWARFLLTWNLCFAFGIQTPLTFMCDHVLKEEYQYLTGIYLNLNLNQIRLKGKKFIGVQSTWTLENMSPIVSHFMSNSSPICP